MRTNPSRLGHVPNTCAVSGDPRRIYCLRLRRTSFVKGLSSPRATSQRNGCHTLRIRCINELPDLAHPQKKLSWNTLARILYPLCQVLCMTV